MATIIEDPAYDFRPYKSMDNVTLTDRVQAVRAQLGSELMILGHHYQQDEVVALSDLRGDSYQLSQMAASSSRATAFAICLE